MRTKFVRPIAVAILTIASVAAAGPPTARPSSPRPVYPAGQTTEATLIADLKIAADGTVKEVTFAGGTSGPFADAARAALSRWTFDSVPGETTLSTPVFFTPPDGINLTLTSPAGQRIQTGADDGIRVAASGSPVWSPESFEDVVLRGEIRAPQTARGEFIFRRERYRVPMNSPAFAVLQTEQEWKPFEIEVVGREVRVRVDGRVVSAASGIPRGVGPIGLTVAEGEIYLRHLRAIRKDRYRDTMPLSVTEPDAVDVRNGVAPVLVREFKPEYTRDAMDRKVQGSVELEAVVEADGTVGPVRLVRLLDPSLDARAVDALERWRFRPALRDGKPVRTRINVELTFTLRSS